MKNSIIKILKKIWNILPLNFKTFLKPLIINVVKIQTGLWNKNVMSNCFSLREINAPRISITFEVPKHDTQALTYEVSVVEDCLAIYSTSSATGRQVLSLTN